MGVVIELFHVYKVLNIYLKKVECRYDCLADIHHTSLGVKHVFNVFLPFIADLGLGEWGMDLYSKLESLSIFYHLSQS